MCQRVARTCCLSSVCKLISLQSGTLCAIAWSVKETALHHGTVTSSERRACTHVITRARAGAELPVTGSEIYLGWSVFGPR